MKNLLVLICALGMMSSTACSNSKKKKTGQEVTTQSSELSKTLAGNSWCNDSFRLSLNSNGSALVEFEKEDGEIGSETGTWGATADTLTLDAGGEKDSVKVINFTEEGFTIQYEEENETYEENYLQCNG